MTTLTTTATTKTRRRFSRAAYMTMAVLPVAALFSAPAFAGQGAASFIDFNGATAGFGTPGGTIAETAAIWSTSAAGTNATTAKPATTQLTVGATASDFAGQTFSINMDAGSTLQGVVINSGNVTLTGSSNEHNNSTPNTWTAALGASLTLNNTRQNFSNASGNASQIKSFNWNNNAVTFTGGGTMNFLTPLGANSGCVNTEAMDSTGVVNLLMALDAGTTSTYTGGFALNSGTLNFASAGAGDQFIGTGSGKFFAINGGTIDNTFTSPITLNLGATGGAIAFGGNFTFTGTGALNTGTGSVLLNANTTINTVANVLTIGGAISGNATGLGLGKIGAGTLVLSNSETYTGVTSVNGGTLQLVNASNNNISSSSGVNITSGTLDVTGLTGGTLALSGSQTLTSSGSILGNVSFTGSTALKDIISGATGNTGTLTGTASFGSNSNLLITQLAAPTLGSYTLLTAASITGLTGTTGCVTHLQTVGRTLYDLDTAKLAANIIQIDVSGGAGNLTWVGTDGTSPSTWENTQATHNWTGTAPVGDVTEFFDGDAVTFTSGGANQNINISGTVNPGNMNVTGGAYSFSGGSIAGPGILTVSGGSLLLNGGGNAYSGGTVVSGGTLTGNVSGAFGTGPVTLTSGGLIINNSGALTTATLTINGGTLDNTSGSAVNSSAVTPITIGGSFGFTGSADLNLNTGNITMTASPTITVSGGNLTLGGKISGGTNGITKNGGGSLILSATSSAFSGGLVINAGSVQATGGAGGNTSIGSGNVTVNAAGTLIGGNADAFGNTIGVSPTTIFIAGGTVTDLGTANYRVTLQDVHFTAGGTLTSNPSNTGNGTQGQYSMNVGTLETDASSVQAVISAGCISLQHSGNTTFTVAKGTVPGGVDLLVSSNLIPFNTTVSSLVKTGTGEMLLTGNNTYLGNTTVSLGTLALASSTVNNNISTSPVVTVASGAILDVTGITTAGGFATAGTQTLANNGTVTGSVNGNSGTLLDGTGAYAAVSLSGGNLTAGNATTIGTLAMASLNVSSGNVTFKFSGATHDLITVTGAATLSNGQIVINPLTPAAAGNYTVLTATSLSGLSAGALANFGRVSYTIDAAALAANTLQLDIAGTPASLTWTGTDTSTDQTAWDNAQNNANWNRTDAGTNGPSNKFFDFDSVTFDNSATNKTVNVNGTVTPSLMTFNSGNYTVNNGTINSVNGVVVNGGNQTIGSTLGGASGVTVNGGVLNLTGSNSYTGVTTINSGVLTINSITNGGNNSPMGASGNVAASLILNGGTLQLLGGGTTDRLFTLSPSGGTLDITTNSVTFNNTGAIAMSGTGARTLTLNAGTGGVGVINSIINDGTGGATSVRVTGTGTWTASATNTYTGTTTINAGATLKPGTNASMGAVPGGDVIVNAGGTLDLGANPTSNNFNFGLKHFHFSGTGNGTAGYGAITNTGISQQNSFQFLVLDADGSIGSSFGTGSQGRMDIRPTTTTLLNATLDLQGHTMTKVGTSQLSLVGTNITQGNIDVQGGLLSLETVTTTNGTGNITFEQGTLSGFFQNATTTSANTTVAGLTWPMIYMGNNTIGAGNGNATLVSAPMILKGNVTLEAISGNALSLTVGQLLTLNGSITEQGGSFSVTKVGVGTDFLGSSASTYSGGLFIKQGNIALSGNNALSPNSVTTFGASGTNGLLDLNGFSTTAAGLATDPNAGASSQIITNNSTNASTLTFITATSTFGGIIQNGNGTVSLAVSSGSLDLTAADTYTGNTTVNGGTLIVDATGSLVSNNVSVASGGTFTIIAGGNIPTAANLTNNGTVNFNNPTRSLATLNGTTTSATINVNSTILTVTTGGSYAGSISGTGGLIVPVGAVQTTGSVNANSLEVDGKQAFTNTTVRTLSKVNSLTVAGSPGSWSGSLDLTSSRLIVEDSANHAADLVMYKNMVANSVNGTVGIYSSTAAGNGQVVVVSDNAVRLASFGAAGSNFGTGIGNVDASSILITTAVLGDANLDGVVDIKDLQDLANHWQQPATDWSQADFDGNGVVALQDLQALANHWQNGVGAPGQGSGESFSDALSLVGQFGGTSSVPEPMSLAILGLGGVVLATRRRKA